MNVKKSNQSDLNERAYRDALGCFGTGVCIITTKDRDGRVRAITANSFSSVSLYPPMILWCIDCSSARFQLFTEAESFAVNMLRADEQSLSTYCAKTHDAELTGDDIAIGETGIPCYAKALAVIECSTAFRQRAGDHVVIFGNVVGFSADSGPALGYFQGGYTEFIKKEG